MEKKLKQGLGNVVTGERFWGREDEIKLFMEKLSEGAHILLVAQRRMGKTSLMKEAAERLKDKCYCLFVDVQKARGSEEAIVELSLQTQRYKNLWQKTRGVFANVLGKIGGSIDKVEIGEIGVTLRAGLTGRNWAAKGDKLFDILGDAADEKPVILMLDEVPIMINRMLKGGDGRITDEGRKLADDFMSWLRKNSIKHQGKVRIVMSGSIGLGPVLKQAGLRATVNNFISVDLEPWDEATATGCLDALGKEYEIVFEKGVVAGMIRRLGCCIPHHVQMYFTHVRDRCGKAGISRCDDRLAKAVYKTDMLAARGHGELVHYEERLKRVLGAEKLPLAIDMLTEAAVEGRLRPEAIIALRDEYASDGWDAKEAQKDILWMLEHDGYLKQGGKGYVFVSKLIRDWWKRRHGADYITVKRRSK